MLRRPAARALRRRGTDIAARWNAYFHRPPTAGQGARRRRPRRRSSARTRRCTPRSHCGALRGPPAPP